MENEAQLIAYLHNGFQISVKGHPKAIDALKDLLIPNVLVKGLNTFENGAYTSKLNYTALKELRK